LADGRAVRASSADARWGAIPGEAASRLLGGRCRGERLSWSRCGDARAEFAVRRRCNGCSRAACLRDGRSDRRLVCGAHLGIFSARLAGVLVARGRCSAHGRRDACVARLLRRAEVRGLTREITLVLPDARWTRLGVSREGAGRLARPRADGSGLSGQRTTLARAAAMADVGWIRDCSRGGRQLDRRRGSLVRRRARFAHSPVEQRHRTSRRAERPGRERVRRRSQELGWKIPRRAAVLPVAMDSVVLRGSTPGLVDVAGSRSFAMDVRAQRVVAALARTVAGDNGARDLRGTTDARGGVTHRSVGRARPRSA